MVEGTVATSTPTEPVASVETEVPGSLAEPMQTPKEEAAPQTVATENQEAKSVDAPETPSAERAVPPTEYKLPEGVPPEIGEFAKQHKFTQEQLDATIQQFGGIIQAQEQGRMQALRNLGEAHLKNWGSNAKHNLGLAKRALSQNDPDGRLAKALNESGYGNHPAVLDFLYSIGKSMQEGGFLKNTVHRPPGEKTAAQAMYGETHPSNE